MRPILALLLLAACSRCEEPPQAETADPSVETPSLEPPEPERAAEAPGLPSRAPTDLEAAREAIAEGRRLAGASDYPGALGAFDRALELLPNAARVRCEAGFLAHRAGDDERAEREIDIALATMPRTDVPEDWRVPLAMCLYNRGLVAEAMDDPERARAAYERSLELRSNDTVRTRLGALELREAEGPVSAVRLVDLKRGLTSHLCDERCSGYFTRALEPEEGQECWEVRVARVGDPETEQPIGDDEVRVLSVTSTECLFDVTTEYLVVKGEVGWSAFRLGATETANTDSFYREESDDRTTLDVRRVGEALVWVDHTIIRSSHYGSDGEGPDEEQCYIDNFSRSITRSAVLCRLDRPRPECGRLVLGKGSGSAWSSSCGDERTDFPDGLDAADDPAVLDARRLRLEDGAVVVEATSREAAGFDPAAAGTYPLDRFFTDVLETLPPASLE